MNIQSTLILFVAFILFISCNQRVENNMLYIDEIKPSTQPLIFAKNFISKDSISEFGSIFNTEGSEFYYAIDSAGKAKIKYTTLKNGKWIEPITIISDAIYSFNDPFLSPDESKLYYISDMPRNSQDTIADYDVWYSEKLDQQWSEPINAGMKINSDADEYYISFTKHGSMYFASNKENLESINNNFDIYKSVIENQQYLNPQEVGDAINSENYEADAFISPDESYIIFCSRRVEGLGRGDLYISFKDENGNWTKAVNMGPKINSKNHELCPFVTKDGNYLFYTSNQDIYWVSTEILHLIKEKR